ncbi:MAG: RluA family pseudouridine synthase [Candidatus Omnitrophica bacterium]|nr:RluA family pseudouridine synthase [Candidatus Omnitrophota bacterium]
MEQEKITITVDRSGSNKRLDIFLTGTHPRLNSRSHIKRLIEEGRICINDQPCKAHYKLKLGEIIVVDLSKEKKAAALLSENIPLNIIYEDEYLLVVDKPAGMATHPSLGINSRTLVNALLYHSNKLSHIGPYERPGIVHRLDKDTSGLMVVAKDDETHRQLAKQFKERLVKKRYIAIVKGILELNEGVIELPIGRHPSHRQKLTVRFSESRNAITEYRVTKRFADSTMVELTPKTGRMHQLRVHMSYIGHPILGDATYGKKSPLINRQALHACTLGFTHPVTKQYVEFTSPIPQDIKRLLELL